VDNTLSDGRLYRRHGILWVPLVNIAAYIIYPTGLAHLVREKIPKMRCVYMGGGDVISLMVYNTVMDDKLYCEKR